jgi:hypothetical protein
MILRLLLAGLLATALCATGQAAEPEGAAAEWKFVSDKDGVALYRRPRPKSYESKAIGEIAATTDLVHAVLDDVESYASFMPYTAECRVLKRDADSVVAYQRLSAPLISDRCAMCHHEGGPAPFALQTYDDIRRRATQIAAVTASRYMPPWKADPIDGPFVGQHPLSDVEISAMQQWVGAGAPSGTCARNISKQKRTRLRQRSIVRRSLVSGRKG